MLASMQKADANDAQKGEDFMHNRNTSLNTWMKQFASTHAKLDNDAEKQKAMITFVQEFDGAVKENKLSGGTFMLGKLTGNKALFSYVVSDKEQTYELKLSVSANVNDQQKETLKEGKYYLLDGKFSWQAEKSGSGYKNGGWSGDKAAPMHLYASDINATINSLSYMPYQ